ncbi:hypothetical protein PAMP_006350 [Pampus punctatissimus]
MFTLIRNLSVTQQQRVSIYSRHFSAAMYSPNLWQPAAAQMQPSNQLLYNSTVQGLRDALYSSINDLKSLKEENKALKEQISLQKNLKTKVKQLKKELKDKDDLLTKVTLKRPTRTRAYDLMLCRIIQQLVSDSGFWKRNIKCLSSSSDHPEHKGAAGEAKQLQEEKKDEKEENDEKKEERVKNEKEEKLKMQEANKMENKDDEMERNSKNKKKAKKKKKNRE